MSLVRKLLVSIPVVLVAGGAAAMAAFYAYGPERVWARSGPADLGDVDFATLARRTVPNDALACGEGLCAAKADVPAPVSTLAAKDLFSRIEPALAQEPRLELVAKEPQQGILRYVQRSLFFRFPDTINVKVASLPGGRSTVLLYSRSQIGKGDMGVNRTRIERWIGLIEAAAQK